MARRAKKMTKNLTLSQKTSKRKFYRRIATYINNFGLIFMFRMKEANAIRSSHIKQAARNESVGRASTGQNWKRSKCEDRDPDARRGSWTDICSKIRSANRTVAMLQVPAAKNSQLSKSQEIMNCPPSPRSQIKLQFGANQPESDLSQRIRKLSNGKRTKKISKNDSVSSGMGPRRRSSVF